VVLMCCRDLNASFGYMIPTLHVMINELDELLLQGDSNGAELTLSLCEPVVNALKTSIIKDSLW